MIIKFTVPGEPVGKGRARAFRNKAGGVTMFTPERTRSYEAIVRSIAAEAMWSMAPIEGPVAMHLRAYFSAPKSLKKADKELARREELPVTKKPDASNVLKAVEDAMNGIVFKDDSQIALATVSKSYSEKPRVEVTITKD